MGSPIPHTTGGNRPPGPLNIEGRILEGHTSAFIESAIGVATTLTTASPKFHKVTATAAFTYTLPAEELSAGLSFCFSSILSGGFAIAIENDAAGTIVGGGLVVNEQVWVVCDGTTWTSMGIAAVGFI